MEADAEPAVYFPVSPRKFVAMSVLTWGLYEIYWFYKNWSFVRARDRSGILPWARALFAPLWYPALLGDLRRNLEGGPIVPGGRLVPAAAYLLLSASWRLPDPFWLVSFLSFAPLLPIVHRINAVNRDVSGEYAKNSSWKLRHLVLALLSAPALVFVPASSIGLIPSTQVAPGWLVWGPSRSFLERSEIVEPGERVLYFYSQGLFSFADDGNLLTERRVISYWTDEETGQLFVENAIFSDIEDTEVEYGNWLDPTVVTVVRRDSSRFVLALSTEEGRDKLFLRNLEKLLQR